MKSSRLAYFASILVLIGALNWGLVGLFNFNLITWIFGYGSFLSRLIFLIVGIAGGYSIFVKCSCKDGCDCDACAHDACDGCETCSAHDHDAEEEVEEVMEETVEAPKADAETK